MVWGLSIETFTQLHVALSLVGIVAGLVALAGMLRAQRPGWITHLFLLTTALTTITGFLFPITAFTPALGTGVVSSVFLLAAFAGLYVFHLAGGWRWVYAASATVALYLNCFVLVVQAFQKIPALSALAPTQSELPFVAAQVAVLAAFVYFGWRAVRRFHPPAGLAAA
jgi:hypothetical protein